MATEVVMPKMGYDMEEGSILRWAKREGDAVAKGEVLGEIETGKVTIEIEAFDAGVLRRILVQEGQTVPVGTPIALIGTADEALPEATSAPAPAPEAAPPPETAAPDPTTLPAASPPAAAAQADAPDAGGRLRASPLARRLAEDRGVDLAALHGSGPNGRVVRDDVLAAPERAAAVQPAALAPAPAASAEDRREPLSGIRRTIAKRLGESWAQAPHIFLTVPIHMDAALAMRKDLNALLEADGKGKVSVNDLVVKAAALSLRAHPRLNASWDAGERVVRGQVNVGVAVALEDGLITVTVPGADRASLAAIAADVGAKAERARTGKLTAQDLSVQGSFTVSNLGGYGVEQFTAILNPPEAGILAVGAAAPEPVVVDGAVVVRQVMRVTLSADHRVVDGATAAEWLKTFRQTLEQPLRLFDL